MRRLARNALIDTVALSALPLLVLLLLGAVILVRWYHRHSQEHARSVAHAAAQHVERLLNATGGAASRRFRMLAADHQLALSMVDRDREQLVETFELLTVDPRWHAVIALDSQVQVIESVGTVDVEAFAGMGEGEMLRLQPAAGSRGARLLFSQGVVFRGQEVGRLMGTFALSDVEEAIDTATDDAGAVLLVNAEGTVLLGPPDLVGLQLSVPDPDSGEVTLPYRGAEVPAAVMPVLGGVFRVLGVQAPESPWTFIQEPLLVLGLVFALSMVWVTRSAWKEMAAAAKLSQREAEIHALTDVVSDAAGDGDRVRIARVVGARAGQLLTDISDVLVAFTDASRPVAMRVFPEPAEELSPVDPAACSLLERALHHGRKETTTDPACPSRLVPHHAKWLCWAPFVAHGRVLGALGLVAQYDRGALNAEEENLVDSLNASMAVALESLDRLWELQRQRGTLATIVASIPDGLAALDERGYIVLDNPALHDMLDMGQPNGPTTLHKVLEKFQRDGGILRADFELVDHLAQAREGRTMRGLTQVQKNGRPIRSIESLMAPLRLSPSDRGVLLLLRDVTDRTELEHVRRLHQRVEELASQAESRAALLDSVLAASDTGFAFVGRRGTVEYCNAWFAKLLNLEPLAVGLSEEQLFNRAGEQTQEDIVSVFQTGGHAHTVSPRRFLEVSVAKVTSEQGERLGTLISLRDRTEQEELEDAREWFMATAAHEIRNGANALQLAAQVALHRQNGSHRQEMEKVVQRVRDLNELVERVLDIAKLELGLVQLQAERTDLWSLCQEVVEPFLSTDTPITLWGPPGVTVWGDPLRLRQVIANLVSNALSHAPNAPIEIWVEERDQEVVVAVRDHGPGIPPEEQAHIFKRARRGGRKRSASGLGVGLYLVRRIAQAHGGRVELDSQVGEGSTFRLVLPKHPRHHEAAPLQLAE